MTTAPQCPTMTVTDAPLAEELRDVVSALLAEGFGVYYYSRDARLLHQSWVIVERGGNVGTLQYDPLTAYTVDFAIKPSRETGSSLMVTRVPRTTVDQDDDPAAIQHLVLAVGLATQDRYKNFATPVALPNHGWAHFDWAKDSLTQLTQG